MSIPEVTQTAETVQDKVEPSTIIPEIKQEEVKEDPNWKVVRELRKKEKAEREAAEKRAQEEAARADAMAKALEAALSKATFNPLSQQNSNQYPEDETEDDRINKKVEAALAKREQQLEKQRQEQERLMLPQIMKQTFPDYDQVVNEDNGAYLKYHYPEIYESLVALPETYANCSNIYKAVKKLVPNSGSVKHDEAKAEQNFMKPKSISSPSLTQSGESISSARLTEERRAQNWERMQKTLRGLS